MKRFTLIFLNEGLEHYIIDEPIGYESKNDTIIKLKPENNHQYQKIMEHNDKFGFESRLNLLVEDGDKLDYFMMLSDSWNNTYIDFRIVEPKIFRHKQIYNPTKV